MKNRYWILMFTIFLIFTGCEKKEQKEEKKVENKKEIKITENVIKEKKTIKKEVDKGEFYYSYKTKKNDEEDIKAYTPVEAYKRIRSPYEKVQISLLANKLSKDFIVHCSACHDDYANGVIGPSLLDKDEDFIYNRLIAYKNKEKANVLMKDLVAKLGKDRLKALAKEIAEFNKKIKKLRAGEKVE